LSVARKPGKSSLTTGRGIALTARQIEILKFISEGHSNKSIARSLGVSEKTVKTHITAIFKELKVVNRTQASVAGRKAGLISF